MERIKSWRIALFALALAAGTLCQIQTIKANRITLGQPLDGGGIYVVQAHFPGGYGAFAFDSARSLEAFAQLPQVGIEPMAQRIQIKEATE